MSARNPTVPGYTRDRADTLCNVTQMAQHRTMPEYRRNRVQGGCYFLTVNLRDRHSDLLVREIETLRAAIRETRAQRPFHIDAWVVLPEHMHCLWTLPENDSDFPIRLQSIKAAFSRSMTKPQSRRPSLIRKREAGIWQRRYWERTVRDEQEYGAYMDYIHFNPVSHGLAPSPSMWPFSTFARCVAQGLYPQDWAGGPGPMPFAGERDNLS